MFSSRHDSLATYHQPYYLLNCVHDHPQDLSGLLLSAVEMLRHQQTTPFNTAESVLSDDDGRVVRGLLQVTGGYVVGKVSHEKCEEEQG